MLLNIAHELGLGQVELLGSDEVTVQLEAGYPGVAEVRHHQFVPHHEYAAHPAPEADAPAPEAKAVETGTF